jgi:hypothetical protein
MAPIPNLVDEVLQREDEGWRYVPGPRTRRIQTWSVTRSIDPVTRERSASIRVTATHPDTKDWIVTIVLVLHDGVVRIRQVAVAPTENGDPNAELTAAIMRRVGMQEVVDQVHWLLKGLATQVTTARAVMDEYRVLPRPGRGGRSDRYYAQVAQHYVGHRDKRAPVQALAKQLAISPTQARDLVHAARQRGLLTGGGVRGRRGGELTEKGRRLLERAP